MGGDIWKRSIVIRKFRVYSSADYDQIVRLYFPIMERRIVVKAADGLKSLKNIEKTDLLNDKNTDFKQGKRRTKWKVNYIY